MGFCEHVAPIQLSERAGARSPASLASDDPYEPPARSEITFDTLNSSVEENALNVLEDLKRRGFTKTDSWSPVQEQPAGATAAV